MKHSLVILVLAAGLWVASPGIAQAGGFGQIVKRMAAQGDQDERRERDEAARFSLDDAVEMVRRELGGKVVRAETRYRDGRPVHYIKVLSDDGRVRNVRVDGRSGRLQ